MRLASIFFLTGIFVSLFIPLTLWAADPALADRETADRQRSLLAHFQYGWPTRYFSQKLYSNFNTAGLNLSYEKECPPVPFLAKFNLLESLLLEFRFLKIWGNNIPLYFDQVSPARLAQFNAAGREPTTNWDTWQIGLAPYYRLYYPITKSFRPYVELGAGLTWLFEELIENGTRWNFGLYTGVGTDFRLFDLPLYAFFRFEHFSNGMKLWSQMGIEEKRLIGPETMVVGLGFRWPL